MPTGLSSCSGEAGLSAPPVECGDEMPEERAQLGYRYCTKAECQAVHYRGLAITAMGVDKSADSFIIADADEIRRRGEAGGAGNGDAAAVLGVTFGRVQQLLKD